ncbi:Uncharacterized protein BM_BM270 [Brugia malayi]|uniref:Pre-mRNA-splicing factor SYF2 n=1 Tax=Brugia malayi TaxID=6279 RepID=A0A0K0J730_BRUMA|nr:Uncharacterized protein BM_BM270 [Brugia malayi]CRZ23094.1 Bm270 [Brugia malayi]VIO99992.1 Uncharacterized protein BM_BM270 [Brugia malayi]
MELKKAGEERGENYGRLKALKTQADLIARKKAIKRKKKPDRGFCDYEAMTLRQYQRLSGNIKPDIKAYEKMREVIEKKHDQYHRRRMFDPDSPIDYISGRNRKFSQKLDRFYDRYTEDLKSDLERRTAILKSFKKFFQFC